MSPKITQFLAELSVLCNKHGFRLDIDSCEPLNPCMTIFSGLKQEPGRYTIAGDTGEVFWEITPMRGMVDASKVPE